jgi:hypothetical protein
VRLTFPKGGQIEEPKKLFDARLDGRSVGAIDFGDGERLPEAALWVLIRYAVALNARSSRAPPVGRPRTTARVHASTQR